MSRPRTSSSILTEISPSGKLPRLILPSGSPRHWAIFSARGRFERPLKTLSLLLLSIVVPELGPGQLPVVPCRDAGRLPERAGGHATPWGQRRGQDSHYERAAKGCQQ